MSAWEADGKTNEWYTPAYILQAMGDPLFDCDVAAPKDGPWHVRCKGYLCRDSLSVQWLGFIFMNPPYGARNGLKPWLDKFIAHGNGVAVVPDRTSAPWFQESVKQISSALFLSPKVKFEHPEHGVGKSPGCGTVLFALGERADECLWQARNLGWLAKGKES